MKYVLVVSAVLFLAACQPGNGITCPELKKYPPEFLQQVADEVDRSWQTSPGMVRMLRDYGVTRNAIRVCLLNQR